MANFKKNYNHDKIAAEEGVWTPIGGGIEVKIRAWDSAHTKALRTKLEEPYKAITRLGKPIPEDDQNEINKKILAFSSLLDWNLTDDAADGSVDENGMPVQVKIPFSGDRAHTFIVEEEQFGRDVISALMSNETFKKRDREEDAKNS